MRQYVTAVIAVAQLALSIWLTAGTDVIWLVLLTWLATGIACLLGSPDFSWAKRRRGTTPAGDYLLAGLQLLQVPVLAVLWPCWLLTAEPPPNYSLSRLLAEQPEKQ
jgi:hypothetical protein